MASLCLANRIISVYCSSVFDVLISSCRSDKNCSISLLFALRAVCGKPATEKKIIKPVIDKVFPFQQADKAHQYIQDRKNFGKVLLDFR